MKPAILTAAVGLLRESVMWIGLVIGVLVGGTFGVLIGAILAHGSEARKLPRSAARRRRNESGVWKRLLR